jgi:hypothetical protein
MMRRAPNRYLVALFSVAGGLYLLLAGINLAVDPFGIYGMPRIDGFNAIKVDVDKHIRLAKAVQVRNAAPKTIIVGSSRAMLGIPATDPLWPEAQRPVYNLSLYGGYLYEAMRYFEHAAALGTVEHALIAVDMWMFDRDWATRPGFSEDRFLVDQNGDPQDPDDTEILKTLFAWDTLRSSLRTISRQSRDDILVQHPDGSADWKDEEAWIRVKEGHRPQFGYMEHMFATTAWWPDPGRWWTVTDPEDPQSPLQFFRHMIRTSYDKGISSRIIISPSHARIWEVIHAGGLWDTWENWKRALVTIVEQEADSAGKPAYEVWDFSGYNAITTEPVSGTTGPMRWYWDGSHFKQAAGRLILSKMFGASAPDVPDRFGAVLNSQNIDAHLSAVREAREMYLIAHPQDAKEAARWSELNK